MRIPVLNTGTIGLIKDVPGYEMPPEAWTAGENVRFQDGAAKKARGWTKAWTPSVDPYALFPIQTPTSTFWVYAGALAAYAIQNNIHYDITRATAPYSANVLFRWNGGNLGGVRVFNNFVDVPQYWEFPASIANKLADLPNWPVNDRCRILRPFKNFLVALNINRGGQQIPNLVKWSHSADVGSVPSSWDITDATLDAGENYLSEEVDEIRDGMRLRDTFYIYTVESVFAMQFIGAPAVFRFFEVFPRDGGILNTGCVAQFESKHFFVTNSDVKIHDGQSIQSVVDSRWRRSLFQDMDVTNYDRTFVAANPPDKEMWICYPQSGSTEPDKALVWNYVENTWGFRDLPGVNHASFGVVDTADDSWDSDAAQWDADSNPWNYRNYDVLALGNVLMGNSAGLYEADVGETKDGAAMHAYVERTGLSLIGPNKSDVFTRKQILRVYPHLSGTGTVSISIATQAAIGGAVTWSTAKEFLIGTDYKVDLTGDGRLLGVRFASSATSSWKLSSYQMEIEVKGGH